jgi:hypothetical protein
MRARLHKGLVLVALLIAAATGCTNDLMKVELVNASATGAGGHWFIGAEFGETIYLMFKLDPADISDPSDWSVKVDGPFGAGTTVRLEGQHTIGSLTIPPSTTTGFTKRENERFTFHLVDSDGTTHESRQWAATIVNNPDPVGRAWLWGAFWTADGERLLDESTQCDSKMSIVAYVGGDLSAASYVRMRVIDVDLVGADEVITSASLPLEPGKRMYESVVTDDLCAGETGSNDSNNVDPKFTATLVAPDGTEIDEIDGPELD